MNIKTHHISSSQEAEMSAEGIHPYVVLEFGIPNADMAGNTFCEAKPGPLTEEGSEVDQNMLPMFLVSSERGDSYL